MPKPSSAQTSSSAQTMPAPTPLSLSGSRLCGHVECKESKCVPIIMYMMVILGLVMNDQLLKVRFLREYLFSKYIF